MNKINNHIMIYKTKDGETLDFICWKYYGKTEGIVEQVLKVNRHLAELPPILKANIQINLPVIEVKKQSNKKIKLWQ